MVRDPGERLLRQDAGVEGPLAREATPQEEV
jgi:hypothetical protein